jgi:hypothetical protein
MSASEPLRVGGELHPVPLGLAALFALFALGGVAMFFSDDGLRVFGAITIILFGGFAALFAIECIPTWIEMDERGLRFRKKLRVERIQWAEVAALGTSIPSEISPGELLVRLTPEACATRKHADPDSMFHVSVPAVEALPQAKLLEEARRRWEDAGGSGNVFDLLGEFFEAGRTLRKGVETLLEIQRRANPETAAALDRMKGRTPTPPKADDDVYCTMLHVRGDDALLFVIVAGSDDLDALAATIRDAADHLVREHRYNPEFGGEIRISLVPDLTPNTDELRAHMDRLTEDLARTFAARGVVATFGRSIRLSWQHGQPS